MEDFRLDIVLGDGINARTINLKLKPFTLIGATTRAGMLSAPLRDRFPIREHLGFYSLPELTEIVRRSAQEAERRLCRRMPPSKSPAAAATRRGSPTTACAGCATMPTAKAGGKATLEVAQAALAMAGIDVLGLDKQDRAYLETIIRVFGGGPAGVEAVAHTMNLEPDTLSRRNRAVSAAQRVARPHPPRPRRHRQGLPAPATAAAEGEGARRRPGEIVSVGNLFRKVRRCSAIGRRGRSNRR